MSYEPVNIEGYTLPDGSTAIMAELVRIADKTRYVQEVMLIQTAFRTVNDVEELGVIGPNTRKVLKEAAEVYIEWVENDRQWPQPVPVVVSDSVNQPFEPLTRFDPEQFEVIHYNADDALATVLRYPDSADVTDNGAMCGHKWRTLDWTSDSCPMCVLTGLVMSIRSRIVSPATDPQTRDTLKNLIAGLEDVP